MRGVLDNCVRLASPRACEPNTITRLPGGRRPRRQASEAAIGSVTLLVSVMPALLSPGTYFPPLAHESFSVTVRLNTGAPGFESTRSATK